MQVGIGNIIFRDSMKFNKASLAKMIDAQRAPYDKWVKDGKGDEPSLSAAFPRMAAHHPFLIRAGCFKEGLELMLRKVPFPYAQIEDESCFEKPMFVHDELYFPIDAYDSELSGKCKSEEYTKTLCYRNKSS